MFDKTLCVNDCDEKSYALVNVRTYDHAILFLAREKWETLLLDWDLSQADHKHSGMDILQFLKDRNVLLKDFLPDNIYLTSGSPDGQKKMIEFMDNFDNYKKGEHKTHYILLDSKA